MNKPVYPQQLLIRHIISGKDHAMDKDQNSPKYTGNKNDQHNTTKTTQVIPVIEEFAIISKEVVDTGKVRIRKSVTEEQALVNLPVINESYDIERVPVNETRDTPPPAVRYEGEVMIIPVTKEITVIQKRYEVVEELRITRKVTETPMMQEITLMKETVHVDRTRSNDGETERF
jgi:uncharacterized protein (TIGR02271 family)